MPEVHPDATLLILAMPHPKTKVLGWFGFAKKRWQPVSAMVLHGPSRFTINTTPGVGRGLTRDIQQVDLILRGEQFMQLTFGKWKIEGSFDCAALLESNYPEIDEIDIMEAKSVEDAKYVHPFYCFDREKTFTEEEILQGLL